MALPYWHLRSEGFWQLVPWPGQAEVVQNYAHSPSLAALERMVSHAQIDPALWQLMADASAREQLELTLLKHWFGQEKVAQPEYQIEDILRGQVLGIAVDVDGPLYGIDVDADEEAVLKAGIFRATVLDAYKGRCAVTGVRHSLEGRPVLVDAHHLIPPSKGGASVITNGIALMPTVRQAFVQELMGFDGEYRVWVDPAFLDEGHAMGLRGLAGRELLLPDDRGWWPVNISR